MADRPHPLRPGTRRAPAPATAATAPAARRAGVPFAAVLAVLALLEVVWFGWYLTVPLPNAQAASTTLADGTVSSVAIRRWFLLAQAIPYFVPGTGWDQSLLGMALSELSHVENLPQRGPIVLAGLLIASAGTGLGLMLLRGLRLASVLPAVDRLPLAFPAGLATLSVLTLGVGRFSVPGRLPTIAALAALALGGLGLELRTAWRQRPVRTPEDRDVDHLALGRIWPLLLFGVLAAPFLVLMVLGSMQPTLDFDAIEYHLQGPKEWYLAGQIAFLPHNVYTSMPFNVEMLHLLGMIVVGDWWTGALVGQFLVMLHTPVAALLIARVGIRWGSPRAAWFAALIYLGTPWLYRLSVFPYVEGPLACYHAALILALGLAWSAREERSSVGLWALVGLIAGGAMACKYPALISAVIPAGAVALAATARTRTPRILLAFGAGLLVTIGPWLLKNTIDHGNPVYPLGYSVFGGHPWSPAREAKWSAAHGPRPRTLPELVTGIAEVAGRNDWQSPLYTALAPLAFLNRRNRRVASLLAGYAVFLVATWWLLTHRLDRFWVPVLPALAILAGLGADWTDRRGWRVLLIPVLTLGLLTTWIYDTTALAALNRWTENLGHLRAEVPRLASSGLAWLDGRLGPGAKPLLVGPAGVFHLNHPIRYNTVFDDDRFEAIARDRTPTQVHEALRAQGITHVFVDWSEIQRHRKPGGYGYTDFVQPERFERLVQAGVLAREPNRGGPPPGDRVLYRVQ